MEMKLLWIHSFLPNKLNQKPVVKEKFHVSINFICFLLLTSFSTCLVFLSSNQIAKNGVVIGYEDKNRIFIARWFCFLMEERN